MGTYELDTVDRSALIAALVPAHFLLLLLVGICYSGLSESLIVLRKRHL